MNLKSAALLALIGTILVTVVLTVHLVRTILGVADGIIPPVTLFPALIDAFGAFSVALFFFVFHKAQS
jgi:hypothetical protein